MNNSKQEQQRPGLLLFPLCLVVFGLRQLAQLRGMEDAGYVLCIGLGATLLSARARALLGLECVLLATLGLLCDLALPSGGTALTPRLATTIPVVVTALLALRFHDSGDAGRGRHDPASAPASGNPASVPGEATQASVHELCEALMATRMNAGAAIRWLRRAQPDVAQAGEALRCAIANVLRASEMATLLRGRFPGDILSGASPAAGPQPHLAAVLALDIAAE